MWLESDKVLLRQVDGEDQELKRLQKQLPEWQNLSEKTLYPASMPLAMEFKIEHAGKVAGSAALTNIRWFNRKAEVRLWILPEFRGKGLAQTALSLLCDLAFNTLNFHRLEAEVYSFNTPALRLMSRAGFKEEGRLREAKFFNGQYYDIIRFGFLRQEYLNLQSRTT